MSNETVELEEALTMNHRKQDYTPMFLPRGVVLFNLMRAPDDGGSVQELFRVKDGDLWGPEGHYNFTVRQVNYSVVEPGAVKAWHLHKKQSDMWFVPPEDKLLVGLRDVRRITGGVTRRFVLGDGKSQLLLIPPGVAHGCANPYSQRAAIIYAVDQFFDREDTDESRLPANALGDKFWEVEQGGLIAGR